MTAATTPSSSTKRAMASGHNCFDKNNDSNDNDDNFNHTLNTTNKNIKNDNV